jgi:hAT family C-terminal dimerisation region
VLHPRHKTVYFQRAGWTVGWITTAKKLLRDEYDRTYRFRDDVILATEPDQSKDAPSAKNIFDDLPAFRPRFDKLDELTRYLCSETEDIKNEDVLKWWYDHRTVYPHLYRMGLDYHTVPCTSYPSFHVLILTIYVLKQVPLLTWSEYSVKAGYFYPTFAIVSLQHRRALSFALAIGADVA